MNEWLNKIDWRDTTADCMKSVQSSNLLIQVFQPLNPEMVWIWLYCGVNCLQLWVAEGWCRAEHHRARNPDVAWIWHHCPQSAIWRDGRCLPVLCQEPVRQCGVIESIGQEGRYGCRSQQDLLFPINSLWSIEEAYGSCRHFPFGILKGRYIILC